jgi:dienelactone hydrolase
MRRDVTFASQGIDCAGWLFVPDDLSEGQQAPAVVMANAFSATKEIYLSNHAERFAAAGFVVLAFDYRTFGDSAGEPRCQIFPSTSSTTCATPSAGSARSPRSTPPGSGRGASRWAAAT